MNELNLNADWRKVASSIYRRPVDSKIFGSVEIDGSEMSFVLIMGGISMKPAVFDGNIVPRRIITLSVALDHRVADAWHGGKLFRYLKRIINNPVVLEESPVTMQGNTPL